MELLESRRLTGPNLLQEREGAVLDVSLLPEETEAAVAVWQEQVRLLLDAVGWREEQTAVRLFPGGASLAISAPIDTLYAATEVNEAAWRAAEAVLHGASVQDLEETAGQLREEIERERNPALLTLRDAAERHGVAFLWDADQVSVGLGTGSRTWPAGELPGPDAVPWQEVHDIPVALVTGTNGKTTTVRLLAAMARAAGIMAGTTSTDRVEVGGEVLDEGDYSGPGGARTLLRDRRVELAVLETARGGVLRRGLVVRRADTAAVTNVAADHLGDYGIHDLEALADAKMLITRFVRPDGRVVLNADDPLVVARMGRASSPVAWFSLDPGRPGFQDFLSPTATAWVLSGDRLERWEAGRREALVDVASIPIAFGGAARYNLANALAALGLGAALGLPLEAMVHGLTGVRGTPEDNPGRLNLMDLGGGVRVLLDYAHNPHGLEAFLAVARSLPARRRLILLGQAGDRSDEAIRDLARITWTLQPDRVVIKELPEMLRGRMAGDVPAILDDELPAARSHG